MSSTSTAPVADLPAPPQEPGTGLSRAPLGAVTGTVTTLLTVLIALAAFAAVAPPLAGNTGAPASSFAVGRALQHLRHIAATPHPTGSVAQQRVREYLVDQLRQLELTPSVQHATVAIDGGQAPYGVRYRAVGTVDNIIARLPGTAPTRPVMLVAHYDSVEAGPGANDDGAAVAALLEVVRALRTGPALRNDVVVVFTDGEELGSLGAKALMTGTTVERAGAVLNFEARGSGGPLLMFQTGPGSAAILHTVLGTGAPMVASSLFMEAYRFLPNGTDFSVFTEHGLPGLNVAYIDGFLAYHSVTDTVANVTLGSLEQHGELALLSARALGGADLSRPVDGHTTYFDVYGTRAVSYPSWLAVPLLAALGGLVIGSAVRAHRTGAASARAVLIGAGVLLGAAFLVAIVITVATVRLAGRYPQFSYYGYTPRADWYFWAGCALAVSTASGTVLWLRRSWGWVGLLLSASLVWLVLAATAVAVAPGAAYLFTWPPLAALAACSVLWWLPSLAGPVRAAVALAGAAPTALLVPPVVKLLFVAATLPLCGVVGLLVVLATGLVAPLVVPAVPAAGVHRTEPWARPVAAGIPVAGVLIAAVLLIGGSLAPATTSNPSPDNLLYALDADRGSAIWATTDKRRDSWTGRFLPTSVRPGQLSQIFPGWRREMLFAEAPPYQLAKPTVERVNPVQQGDQDLLTLRVRSARGSTSAILFVTGAPVLGCAVDGVPVPPSGSDSSWQIVLWTMPARGADVTLTLPAHAEVTTRIMDRTAGLPSQALATAGTRPPTTIPAPSLDVATFSNATWVSATYRFPPLD